MSNFTVIFSRLLENKTRKKTPKLTLLKRRQVKLRSVKKVTILFSRTSKHGTFLQAYIWPNFVHSKNPTRPTGRIDKGVSIKVARGAGVCKSRSRNQSFNCAARNLHTHKFCTCTI
jgi:hypothetical protein